MTVRYISCVMKLAKIDSGFTVPFEDDENSFLITRNNKVPPKNKLPIVAKVTRVPIERDRP